MNLFQSSNRALSVGLIGLKEAFMAVAERVARRVQVAKLQFQADDTEARLRQAYEYLGQCLYTTRSEEHTSELQSRLHLACRLLLEKKKKKRELTIDTI